MSTTDHTTAQAEKESLERSWDLKATGLPADLTADLEDVDTAAAAKVEQAAAKAEQESKVTSMIGEMATTVRCLRSCV